MVLIYPVGVPLLFFVMLHLQRDKIIRVMLVQKALEDRRVPEYDDTMSEKEKAQPELVNPIIYLSPRARCSLARSKGVRPFDGGAELLLEHLSRRIRRKVQPPRARRCGWQHRVGVLAGAQALARDRE